MWKRLAIAILAGSLATGCNPQENGTTSPNENGDGGGHAHAGHSHDGHDHHGHGDTGPHDGHILETNDAAFHAEWVHDEDGAVTVYILNDKGDADQPIDTESVTIETSITGGDSKTYTLAGEKQGEPSAAFSIKDPALLAVLKMTGDDAATAQLKFQVDGKDIVAAIKHEDHDHAH